MVNGLVASNHGTSGKRRERCFILSWLLSLSLTRNTSATSHSATTSSPSNPVSQETPGVDPAASDTPNPAQTVGLMSDQGEFVGATHWEAVLESIHDLRGYIEAESQLSSEYPTAETAGLEEPDMLFGPIETITIEDVLDVLPSRAESDNLLSIYFKERFLASPMLHVPHFRRIYDSFWANPYKTSFLWISILFSTLAAATVAAEARTAKPTSRRLTFMVFALRCLLAGEYLKAKPFAVEAVVLYALTRLAQYRDPDPYLWSIFGLATRLAQRMGYHRDPERLASGRNAKITPFESEMRRRTWFAVEAFDLIYSFQLGMPTIIHDEESDVLPPSNLFDEDFDIDTEVMPASRPETEVTPTLYYRHKCRLIRLLRRLARHALGTCQPEYSATLELDAELRALHDRVPPFYHYAPIQKASFRDQSQDILQRTGLEMMHLKSLAILHRPYLTYQKENPKYALSRKTCRDCALQVMELHADIVQELEPGGRLYADRHQLIGLTLHDFLLAAMILCLDLNESVLEPADRAHKLAMLQQAYATWSKRRHTSQEALHATNVLGAMLRKVSRNSNDFSSPQRSTVVPPSAPTTSTTAPAASVPGDIQNGAFSWSVDAFNPPGPAAEVATSGMGDGEPGVILPRGTVSIFDPKGTSGFTTADVFDFSDWNAGGAGEDTVPEFMDMDIMPLESFMDNTNNLDWVSMFPSPLITTRCRARRRANSDQIPIIASCRLLLARPKRCCSLDRRRVC